MSRGTVVVTGASTGIGEATAGRLARMGYAVLAGARKDEDLLRLDAVRGVQAIRLDVTSEPEIAALQDRVGERLDALVNNAGVAITGPVEVVGVEEWRRQLEINLLGQVAVTRALLPALIAARGRVVNMSSIGGRVALPLFGPYAASKFGLEAMTDALRRETRHLGVHVVSIEPGGVATPIWDKGLEGADAVLADASDAARERYAHLTTAITAQAQQLSKDGLPPLAVADVVATALTADKPRTRYVVGRDARIQAALARVLPERAFDALLARALR